MKTLTWISLAIALLLFAYFKIPHFSLRLLDTKVYTSNTSEWISLKGKDEFVITELKTRQTFDKHKDIKISHTEIVTGSINSSISLYATFKYFIKLAQLKYTIEGDTLVFHIHQVYLSTPVAYDSATLEKSCTTTRIAVCGNSLDNLEKQVTAILEEKGNQHLTSVYEKAAKSLADNFDAFIKNNNKDILYKNIAVIFDNEPSRSEHKFKYNKSYCGNDPCKFELPLSNGRILTIH